MYKDYLRAFVIGSCFFVFFPFFFIVSQFSRKKSNIDYVFYTYYAPLVLGLFNVFSLYISDIYHLVPRSRFLFISLFAPTIVLMTVVLFKVYNYTWNDWIIHILKLYLLYFCIFNGVVYLLDKYV
jgi:hypothetical protein